MKRDRELLYDLLVVRSVEQEIARRYSEQQMRCPTHLCIGQEATAVGVCAALRPEDVVFSGHRSHGHYLAKGGDLTAMLAELYGRGSGCSAGKGGSMHLVDLSVGFLGAVPIVGSTIPMAVGAALGFLLQKLPRVSVVFFGDAAVEEGVTWESIDFALLERLPVVFVCENNLYSVQTPLSARQPAGRTIAQVAAGHGVETESVDGNDVFAVQRAARAAVDRARAGGGPTFLELATYRHLEHVGPNEDVSLGYRSAEEVEAWRARCPVEHATRVLLERGELDASELDELRRRILRDVRHALELARDAPEAQGSLLSDVFASTVSPIDGDQR
ncbi:MAG: thiamine pyrophosphate-dependent dehydrogenase E1 component subunit alpha [Polyangiaceae bacterium]|nr:thiamine pyrophosphate-dependent dehydrogenase E1 component subunit alpha [Polyangiaceae bacterium]